MVSISRLARIASIFLFALASAHSANAWKLKVFGTEVKGDTPKPLEEFDQKRLQVLEAPGEAIKDAENDARKLGKDIDKNVIIAGKGLEHFAHETGKTVQPVGRYVGDHPFETVLFILLVFLTYRADDAVAAGSTVLFVALSVLPALVTLGCLWRDATRAIGPLKDRADKLEKRCLGL